MGPVSALLLTLGALGSLQVADTLPALTLEEALRLARLHNADYRAALARADALHDQKLAAWGAFLPGVDASVSFNRFDVRNITFPRPEGSAGTLPEPLETTTFSTGQGLSFRWQVFDGGRRFFELRRSRAAARAGEYLADAARLAMEAEVAKQ